MRFYKSKISEGKPFKGIMGIIIYIGNQVKPTNRFREQS